MALKLKMIPVPAELQLLNYAHSNGSGEILKDTLAPFAFFVLLRWVERQEREEEAIALFDERPYEPLLAPRLSWSNLTALDPTELFRVIHQELLPTLEHLEGGALADILRAAAYAFDPQKLTETLLYQVLRLVAAQPFETAEDLRAVEKLIRKILRETAEEIRYVGEFITPARIARLMLEIAAPKPGESVYDPCFGMGSLLEGAARRMTQEALNLDSWQKIQTSSIYGVEKASIPYLVGLTRVLLAGVQTPRLSHGDAFERYYRAPSDRYDVILAAPPVGGRVNDRALHEHFPVRATSTENLFLQHIMASLKPNGRAVVALPEGFLFRGGTDEQVRKMLLTDFCVEGVISLPAGSFLPYTTVKANLFIFRRGAPPQDAIWFQEARPTSRSSNRAVLFDAKAEFKRFAARQEDEKAWLTPLSEIIERGYDLSVRRRRSDELEAFIKDLHQHDPQLEVVSLEQVAEVISGIGYTRRDTSPEPTLYSAPLIRVTELGKDGELKRAKLHLNDVILGRTAAERRLQPGDIVLSTQGTLGKVGIVRESHAGGVPAHGITTIRLQSEKVQPLYLVRLLQSGPYQQWLAAHASGTTIMNLPVRDLRQLAVPLPSVEVQRAIATGAKAGADTTELLKAIVSGRAVDDFLSFLFSDPTINDLVTMRVGEGEEANQFARLAAALRPWRNKAAHDVATGDPALSLWLLKTSHLTDSLRDTFDLSNGAERLAVFGILQTELDELDGLVNHQNDEAVKARLWLIANTIRDALFEARQRTLEKTPVSVALDSDLVDAGVESELVLSFRNEGNLPIRRLVINTAPDYSEAKTNILGASEDLVWSVRVPPRTAGEHVLTVKWKALRLDSKVIGDEVTLVYTARERANSNANDIGTNPYIVGSPLTSSSAQEMFFGREDVIEQVRRSLRQSGPSTVLLLEGNRRTGKTSILYRLQKPGVLQGWITAYWNAQRAQGSKSAAGLEDKEIFYNLSRELILAAHGAGYSLNAPGLGFVRNDTPQAELRTQLREALRPTFDEASPYELLDILLDSIGTAVTDKRVLLILDEFDKIQDGIDNRVTSPQVPENLRALFHKHEHLSGILTGARRIKHLREDHWSALYGIGVAITVDALDVDAARQLVTEPVKGRLVYTFNARERVIELTACQPFLLQALCYRIFEVCARTNERSVTVSVVDVAIQEMVTDSEHFRSLFDYIRMERPRYLTCVINRLSEAGERVTFDLIAEELENNQIQYDTTALADDLKFLQELDVIDLEQHELGTAYKIKIPLFSLWLNKHEHEHMHRHLAAQE